MDVTYSGGRPTITLVPESAAVPGMMFVPAGPVTLGVAGTMRLPDYWIDKYEVTNAEFKRFVDAGGYTDAKYWQEPLVEGTRVLSFAEAMARPATSRNGASTRPARPVFDTSSAAAGTIRPIAFREPEGRNPWDRAATFGVRLIKNAGTTSAELGAPIAHVEGDPASLVPVSDEQFALLRQFYSYDHNPVDGRVDAVDDSSPHWRKETVSFAAAYGGERIPTYLFLPKNARPPFQTVVFFPTSYAREVPSSRALDLVSFDFHRAERARGPLPGVIGAPSSAKSPSRPALTASATASSSTPRTSSARSTTWPRGTTSIVSALASLASVTAPFLDRFLSPSSRGSRPLSSPPAVCATTPCPKRRP